VLETYLEEPEKKLIGFFDRTLPAGQCANPLSLTIHHKGRRDLTCNLREEQL
jgi:hypothetical protein